MSELLDPNGKTSAGRFIAIMTATTGCAVALGTVVGFYLTSKGIDSNIPWLVATLIGGSAGLKVGQKMAEVKSEK